MQNEQGNFRPRLKKVGAFVLVVSARFAFVSQFFGAYFSNDFTVLHYADSLVLEANT
jgi:hypothetical protein